MNGLYLSGGHAVLFAVRTSQDMRRLWKIGPGEREIVRDGRNYFVKPQAAARATSY